MNHQPGDLIRHRNSRTTHRIQRIQPDGHLIVHNPHTGRQRILTRPEYYLRIVSGSAHPSKTTLTTPLTPAAQRGFAIPVKETTQ